MVRKFEYTPILGWSISRYDTFRLCKRQYYYKYYPSHDTEFDRMQINLLKGLTSVPLEIGNVTHEVIKALLLRLKKNASEIDRERFLDYARRETLEISREKTFSEVYYKQADSVDPETEVLPKVQASLLNFLDSETMPWLIEKALASKEEWIVEPEGYGECRIDDQKAYCKVDFLFPIGDTIHIYDWKTGKKDDAKHGKQMKGYVTWAHFHFGVDFKQIKPTVAYLYPEYEERSVELNEFEIEDFSDQIRHETEEMYVFCKDVDRNIPFEKPKFEMTENLNICRYCNFRELCGRE